MTEAEPTHPFKRSHDRYVKYAREYRVFVERYSAIFERFKETDARFRELDRVQPTFSRTFEIEKEDGSAIENAPPPTIQFEFMEVPLRFGRRGLKGETAVERGAVLVYSFGGSGAVAVMLYPAKGNLGTTIESSILLRVGYFDADQLLWMLPSDLRHWVDYAHVSALDGDPTKKERICIWWLRLRQILYMDNKPQPAILSEKLKKLGGAAATGSLSGIMKIAGGGAAGFALGYLVG